VAILPSAAYSIFIFLSVALSQICVLTQIQNIKQTRQIADLAELITCTKLS